MAPLLAEVRERLDPARRARPPAVRIAAAIAPVLVSAGFFGLAFNPSVRSVLYLGGVSLFVAVLPGVGLLRKPGVAALRGA